MNMLEAVRVAEYAKHGLYMVSYDCRNCVRRFSKTYAIGTAAPDSEKCNFCGVRNSYKTRPE